MKELLHACRDNDVVAFAAGDQLIREGASTGHLYVLVRGALEVYRDDVSISIVTEPGAVVGEMSLLLDVPHTASVRALEPSDVYVIDNGLDYLQANPAAMVPIARLLAYRLQGATGYLVNLKHQFQDHSNHLAIVDEIVESIIHQQDPGAFHSGEPKTGNRR